MRLMKKLTAFMTAAVLCLGSVSYTHLSYTEPEEPADPLHTLSN